MPGEDSNATGGGAVRPGTPGLPATCLYSHRKKGDIQGLLDFQLPTMHVLQGVPATCLGSHIHTEYEELGKDSSSRLPSYLPLITHSHIIKEDWPRNLGIPATCL